ncbi:MAG TPA: PBP1A family penicillin-binding protein [Acidimicrobiales bacterium]|nr:PBP1A family penicillin-binding protein [Acidimicrobiales bacterium]
MSHRLSRLLALVVAGGALLAITAALLTPAVGTVLTAHETTVTGEIDLASLAQRSQILDANGDLITYLYREENRAVIPLEQMPTALVDSVLQVEDASFWHHGGIDVQAIGRALLTNVESGSIEQGGSTITQQLVKNLLLDPEQSIGRKVREAVLAVKLEDRMSKEEILERYLNTVYLGNGTYGVQAAAELYFGVSAEDLDRAQSAFLAGLIRNPVGYDPFVQPDATRARRDLVADILHERGSITEEEAAAIKETPIPSEPFELVPRPKDYFIQEVIQRLLDDPRLGETQSQRYSALFRGGLTIRTTLDPRKQWLATAAVADVLPDTDGRFTAAVVSVEPGTGAVRAMVGGPGFEEAKYNITTQGVGRQAGSSFKPFVLAAAIDAGISPRSRINGIGPCRLPNEGGTPDPWEVSNYDGSRGGIMDLVTATQRSMNCAYARLALVVGLDEVAATTERLGITSPLPEVPSMALGALEVLPIDMAAAYATFANDGIHAEPYLVDEVRDRNDRVIFRHEPELRLAISPDAARTVTAILEGAVASGTGTRARFPDRRDVAGKTGTTSDYADAWFVGYTPQLATAVWMGSPTGTADKMTNVGGVRVTGGSYPARIWQAYMGPAMADLEPVDFPAAPPAGTGEYLFIPGEPSRPPGPRPTTPPSEDAPPPRGGDGDGGGGGDNQGEGRGPGRSGGDSTGDDADQLVESGQTEPSG